MASSKGKARNRPEKKRITEQMSRPGIRSRVKSTRKRANTPYRRRPYESVSIPQLVYELLTIDKYNQEAKRFSSPEHFRTPRQRMQKYHEQQRLPYEAVDHRDSPESVQVSDYVMESRPTSIESLTEVMDAANSSAPPSSANSSVSNISMEPITLANSLNSAKALFRKRSLVQLINKYIKAGIEEGKRQAKKYIRKALSFGVRSGYLIPDDPQGNVLRVCSTLDTGFWSSRKTDAESRQRRRIARRGEIHQTTIDDRKAMRRGIPRDKPRHDADNEQITSKRRRYRRHTIQSPARSISTRDSSPRKSPGVSKSKPKTIVKRRRIDSTVNNKRRQQRKRGNSENAKKPVKKRRMIASPKRLVNDHEPVEKSHNNVNNRDRDQYKRNEDSYKAIIERRKSSSREDGSSMEKQKAGTSTNDDRDKIERRNADDDEKSEETNIEHDTNDTIRQMDP